MSYSKAFFKNLSFIGLQYYENLGINFICLTNLYMNQIHNAHPPSFNAVLSHKLPSLIPTALSPSHLP